jgi:predicted O-methyltransferase YrrM
MVKREIRVVTKETDLYLEKTIPKRDAVLKELEKHAEKNQVPILGPHVGTLLSVLARSTNAKNILEVGTATGYSGIWLARIAAANSGRLITVENDPEMKKIADESFRKAGLENSVEIILGDAREVIPRISETREGGFDLILMDVGEKKLYIRLLDDCIRALRKGGVLIADDTLWHGSVVISTENDPDTRVMRKFNKTILQDDRVESIVVPIGDGVTIAVKK